MYQEKVVTAIVKMGQSETFGWWALGQVDVDHYRRKYTADELAELLIAQFAG